MSQQLKTLKLLTTNKAFGGFVKKFEHVSPCLGGLNAKFSVYLPPQSMERKVPVLFWLSGLTCNEDNFMQKAGAQKIASSLGLAIVCPDTSPRGANIPGEDDLYDFGTGAGFYVDSKQEPYKQYYNMDTYVNNELKQVLSYNILNANDNIINLPLDLNNISIFGHSMGGHGALISYFRNNNLYKSVSAFSPICNPINCRWGQKCFNEYLGIEAFTLESWKSYDSCHLASIYNGNNINILIDQGSDDNFLNDGNDNHNQLLPQNLIDICKDNPKIDLNLRFQKGYDHSYYFISSFIQDHLNFHKEYLL